LRPGFKGLEELYPQIRLRQAMAAAGTHYTKSGEISCLPKPHEPAICLVEQDYWHHFRQIDLSQRDADMNPRKPTKRKCKVP